MHFTTSKIPVFVDYGCARMAAGDLYTPISKERTLVSDGAGRCMVLASIGFHIRLRGKTDSHIRDQKGRLRSFSWPRPNPATVFPPDVSPAFVLDRLSRIALIPLTLFYLTWNAGSVSWGSRLDDSQLTSRDFGFGSQPVSGAQFPIPTPSALRISQHGSFFEDEGSYSGTKAS